MTDVDMIKATEAYKRMLGSGKKHIKENEYVALSVDACREAFPGEPDRTAGFNSAMGWWHHKRRALREALQSDGIMIHFNDEFETQFREWYDNQELPIANGPLHALKIYSEKRKEFEELYRKNNDWI